jgi:hypothetical protein
MPARRVITATDRRLAELERQAEQRLPDSHEEIVNLWSWVPVPEREQLEIEIEAAEPDSDAMLAAKLGAERALLLAQQRRANDWPRDWWTRTGDDD